MHCLSELVSSGKLQQHLDTSSWGGPVNNYSSAGHNNNSNSYGIPAGRVGKNPVFLKPSPVGYFGVFCFFFGFFWVFLFFFIYLPRRESF
jgi:hypothetical protein